MFINRYYSHQRGGRIHFMGCINSVYSLPPSWLVRAEASFLLYQYFWFLSIFSSMCISVFLSCFIFSILNFIAVFFSQHMPEPSHWICFGCIVSRIYNQQFEKNMRGQYAAHNQSAPDGSLPRNNLIQQSNVLTFFHN